MREKHSRTKGLAAIVATCGIAAGLSLAALAQPPATGNASPSPSTGQMDSKADPNAAPPGTVARPEVTGTGAMRGRASFGTFGVIGAMTPETIGVQGATPGIPIMQVPLKGDSPVFTLKKVKLSEISEPTYATVRGNLAPGATTMSPAFITFESKTMTKEPPNGPGYYTGIVTVKDGKAVLKSGEKEIQLVTADNTPMYRSSAATREDLRKGTNVFISRKYNPDGKWGDNEAAYILPEGPLPAISNDMMADANAPMPMTKHEPGMKEVAPTSGTQSSFDHSRLDSNPSPMGMGGGPSAGSEVRK